MTTTEQDGTRTIKAKGNALSWAMILVGATGVVIAGLTDLRQVGYSWLVSFLFYLSLCLGALFVVLIHHLCDASWSVPIRRFCEHIACLSFPALLALFLPIAVLAPKIYPQLTVSLGSGPLWQFCGVSLLCFICWGFLSHRLRYWSLQQDVTGTALCTLKMRTYSATGIFIFASTLTLAAIFWIKGLSPGWPSTIYGAWYFAASLWVSYATIYVIAVILQRSGSLRSVLRDEQFYFLGSLFLAFTVFYGYIAYSQYFVIWNGNLPEETVWYTLRERGHWKMIGLLLVFGHFLVPFLALLRIDWKLKLGVMLPVCAWAWLMHFADLQFQIMPVLNPEGPTNLWVDFSCLLFQGGILTRSFLLSMSQHPAYPQRDPRLAEALGIHLPPTTDIATAPERPK